MKIVIFGDSHNNIANINHVMGFAKKIKVSVVIHTGDWNNVKSLDTVLNYNIPLYTVLGNADIDSNLSRKLKIYSKKFDEDFLKIEVDGIKIGIVHRLTNNNINNFRNSDFIFTGHYHSQKEWEIEGIKIIRPGALENGINFAIFDTKTKMVEFVNHDKI